MVSHFSVFNVWTLPTKNTIDFTWSYLDKIFSNKIWHRLEVELEWKNCNNVKNKKQSKESQTEKLCVNRT